MWNALVSGAAGARLDRDDRRQPAAPRPALAVAARRGDRRHADGRQPRVPHGLPQGGRASRRRSSTCRGCGRSARRAARCRRRATAGWPSSSAPTCCSTWAAAAPTSAPGIVQGSPLQPVWAGEISGPCLGVDAQAFDEKGERVVGELGELVITAPMPSMPVGFWGDPDGTPLPRHLLRRLPGRVAPRRLGALLRGRQRVDRRAAPTPPSTAAACGWAPPSSTGWSRSCPRSPTASSCTWRTRRAATASCCSSCSCATGSSSTTPCAAGSRTALRTELSPRHIPDADRRGAGGPAQPHRQEAGAAGQEDPARRRARRRRQPRRARRPDLAGRLRRPRAAAPRACPRERRRRGRRRRHRRDRGELGRALPRPRPRRGRHRPGARRRGAAARRRRRALAGAGRRSTAAPRRSG